MSKFFQGRLWTLFSVFFKISAVSVGGGLTMLPLISKEFSEDRDWLTGEEMVDVVAIVQSVPGIIAVNMAILVGNRAAGLAGVFAAAFGVVVPPVAVIITIAALLFQFAGNETMDHIFLGVRAAVSALILLSVIKMGRSVLKNPAAVVIALLGFILLVFFDADAVGMIFGAAVVGLALGGVQYLRLKKAAGEGNK